MPSVPATNLTPTVLPAAVQEAAADWRRTTAGLPHDSGFIERGDLRVVSPPGSGGDRRAVLVTDVRAADGYATVALVHSFPEMTASVDAAIGRAVTGAPYAVVVQTDLISCVWLSHLGRLVGRTDPAEVQAAVSRDDADMPEGMTVGSPLTGPADRRWAFKETEGRALRCLTADAVSVLLNRSSA